MNKIIDRVVSKNKNEPKIRFDKYEELPNKKKKKKTYMPLGITLQTEEKINEKKRTNNCLFFFVKIHT